MNATLPTHNETPIAKGVWRESPIEFYPRGDRVAAFVRYPGQGPLFLVALNDADDAAEWLKGNGGRLM